MGQDNSKKMLFEAMHKVAGMPTNEVFGREPNQQEGETYNDNKKFELSNEINALKKKYMETMTPFDFFNGIILGLGVGGGINNDDYSKEVRQYLKDYTPSN
jgi:hypothetical protein